MPIVLRKLYMTQYDLRKGVIDLSLWLPWQLSYLSNAVCTWCLLLKRSPMTNIKSIQLETKELLTYHCGCHGNLVIIVLRHMADAYYPKEAPCQI